MLSPHDAPVRIRSLKGSPFLFISAALVAKARGVALAAPAGVNPLKATVSPFLMWETASSAVIFG
jgi:hypothetical protein